MEIKEGSIFLESSKIAIIIKNFSSRQKKCSRDIIEFFIIHSLPLQFVNIKRIYSRRGTERIFESWSYHSNLRWDKNSFFLDTLKPSWDIRKDKGASSIICFPLSAESFLISQYFTNLHLLSQNFSSLFLVFN